ncbi:MAG: aromatic amino acid transport family protein [Slackia sp.]|nr:aromatic amino acid transport family protein [Slackia sp.]
MDKKLTVWQAACIITGYGVGSGIMTLPYLANRAGLGWSALILIAAFFFSYCMHMMLAELALGGGKGTQIIAIFKKYLFNGPYGRVFVGILFALTVLVLTTNLAAYIAGGAEILAAAGIPTPLAQLAFYAVAAGAVFFGLKAIGISESASIIGIISIIAVLAGASLFHMDNPFVFSTGEPNELLAFFGMAMFAFVAFFSVPQAVEGLDHDRAKIRKAILLGLGMNTVFIAVIVVCATGSSTHLTELGMIGWSEGIGAWAQVLGSVFTILAMLTTYWSISLALGDIIEGQTHFDRRICWLCATLPSLLLVMFNLGGFLEIMRMAGGLIAIMIAVLVVPAFRRCRKECGPQLLPAALASTPMQVAVLVAFLVMAAGSMVSI